MDNVTGNSLYGHSKRSVPIGRWIWRLHSIDSYAHFDGTGGGNNVSSTVGYVSCLGTEYISEDLSNILFKLKSTLLFKLFIYLLLVLSIGTRTGTRKIRFLFRWFFIISKLKLFNWAICHNFIIGSVVFGGGQVISVDFLCFSRILFLDRMKYIYFFQISDWFSVVILFIWFDFIEIVMASGVLFLEYYCTHLVHSICK